MKTTSIFLALVWSAGAIASPPPEVHTGTNTNRDTAQPVYGTGNVSTTALEAQPTDEALAVGRDMARCVAYQHPTEVKVALQAGKTDDFRQATKKLYGSLADCMVYAEKNLADVSYFDFGPSSLAGLLAEAMLARNGIPALAPAKYEANAPKLDGMAGSPASLVQLRLAECLAQTRPDAVAALVRSTPSSPQELAAFQALAPSIPGCLDKNVTLKATRSSLRLALALALYRRTLEPPTGVAAR